MGTASAAPAKSTTSYSTAHHCQKVKGHFETRHGKRGPGLGAHGLHQDVTDR
ncbi:hypothetical protein ACFY0A_31750 [Streptomyces sp. NPDC001698]|uniref:hypothetical protein n=1 Tax=unclassified Streptomyces TaxID=2593676 RepID=UPI0036CCE7E9